MLPFTSDKPLCARRVPPALRRSRPPTLLHLQRSLGEAQIAPAQLDALALGQIDQLLDRAVDEPRVRWMGDRFLLHGGVHHNPFEILGCTVSELILSCEIASRTIASKDATNISPR